MLSLSPELASEARHTNVSATSAHRALQDPQDCVDRVPIPGRRRHTVEFVDLAKIADRLHVTTVHPKHELSIATRSPEPATPRLTETRLEATPGRHRLSTGCSRIEQHPRVTDRAANGFFVSRRKRSRPSQSTTSVEWQLSEQRSTELARDPGLRTTNVPAAPTLTTSKSLISLARMLGRNVRCPPTLTPRRNTTRAMGGS